MPEETELSFLCMLANEHARARSKEALAVLAQERIRQYGLGPDGYQSHQLLRRAGIIDVKIPEDRRADGTFKNYYRLDWSGSEPPPHRFRLREEGLAQQALPKVLNVLKHLSAPRF